MGAQLSPVTMYWRALAMALMLAGTAGVGIWGVWVRGGAGVMPQGGEYAGEVQVGLRQQVVRRTLRAEQKGEEKGEGERREQQRSDDDGVEGWKNSSAGTEGAVADNDGVTFLFGSSSSYAAAAAAANDAAAAAAAAADDASAGNISAGNDEDNTREAAATAAAAAIGSTGGPDHAIHRALASGSAVEAASPSTPLPSTLPSPSLGRPWQQANSLPPECRDGSANEAVTAKSVRHDYRFPTSSSQLSLYPYEVTLTNTCGQRAIAAMGISLTGLRLRSYILLPRLVVTEPDSLSVVTNFKVLPPLGAPDSAVVIPPGGSLKFNCTVVLDVIYALTVHDASFSPL
ncbi:unnamed protein product [Closterium sp. Naga37s-1]|nr:unnamed protein product [Closterium sp. Naga37s-1]